MSRATQPLSAFDELTMGSYQSIPSTTTCYRPEEWYAIQGQMMAQAAYPPNWSGLVNFAPYYSLTYEFRHACWHFGLDPRDYPFIGESRRWRPKPLPKSRWWAVWTKEFWFPKPFDLYEVAEWVP
jgi:hypothetical protein